MRPIPWQTRQHAGRKDTNILFYVAEALSSEGTVNKMDRNTFLLERWNPALRVGEEV